MAAQFNPAQNFNRKYPRYNVSAWKHIVARIDRNRSNEQIVMIGNGGCGFYGFERGYPGKMPHRVFCEFVFRGGDYAQLAPIVTQGNLIYTTPVDVGSIQVFFHGIEFLPSEREKLKPLISILESLHIANKIPLT